jgi:hypothetical protein
MVIFFIYLFTFIHSIVAQGDGCVLIVPDFPLTPQGLMTPYILAGAGCNQANPVNARFVHAVVVNTQTGSLFVYDPLVISQGMLLVSQPAPVNFSMANSVVGIWMGSNSNFLTLTNTNGIANGRCVTGPGGSPFGQFAWCNADVFWASVNTLLQNGLIALPQPGVAFDGSICPTLRDFFIIDMDPDDGVQTLYLVTTQNQVIQDTTANRNNFNIQATLANDGDNRLITEFVNPAIGCKTLVLPNAADPGKTAPAIAINILQAMMFQAAPLALTPNNDPMVTTNAMPDLVKLNLYRMGVNQPQAAALGGDNDPATFCRNYATVAVARFKSLNTFLKAFNAPAPGFANLFAFMINRATTTYTNLNCLGLTGITDPFTAIQ